VHAKKPEALCNTSHEWECASLNHSGATARDRDELRRSCHICTLHHRWDGYPRYSCFHSRRSPTDFCMSHGIDDREVRGRRLVSLRRNRCRRRHPSSLRVNGNDLGGFACNGGPIGQGSHLYRLVLRRIRQPSVVGGIVQMNISVRFFGAWLEAENPDPATTMQIRKPQILPRMPGSLRVLQRHTQFDHLLTIVQAAPPKIGLSSTLALGHA